MQPFRVLVIVALAFSSCSGRAPRAPAPTSETSPSVSSIAPSVAAVRTTASADPLYVAVVGDWGASSGPQREIAERMCLQRKRTPFRDVITTGDNFYQDGTATNANYYAPERCLFSAPNHRWRATWGNHDVRGVSTRSVLGAPRTYTWSSRGVDFFALDANNASSRTQRDWLRSHLAASTARIKIVVFHQPPYTSSSDHVDDAVVKSNWVPLFERYDVTLVLNGHAHLYEHSRVRGVDYVVSGGGGRFLHSCARRPPTLLMCRAAYHFLLLAITRDRVVVTAVTRSGATLDRFSVRV